jgi:alpha-L-fucosidase
MRSPAMRLLLVALLAVVGPVLTPPAAQAAPGDNYAVDDVFTSARTKAYRDDRFGMFIHFGLYSAYRGEYRRSDGTVCRDAEWIKRQCAIPWSEYEAKATSFNPSGFDAKAIVSTAKAAGQKYIVITSKHHDGFAMWPTKVNDWNINARTPFKRDILGELAAEARAQGVKLGFYYSIWDWHDPDAQPGAANYPAYVDRMKAQVRELVTNYGPSVLWFDGEWENPWTAQYGAELEAYVRQLSPNAVVNNRVGKRRVNDGDFGTPEQEIPAAPVDGQLWESCMTINGTWGYTSWDTNFKSVSTLTRNLAGIVASSGNYLLNVGPDDRGVIPRTSVDRLRGMGSWVAANSSAIYGAGAPGVVAQPSWGVVSRNGNRLYASVYNWSSLLHLTARAPFQVTRATVLATGANVPVQASGDGYDLRPPGSAPDAIASVIALDIVPASPSNGTGTGLTAQFWNNTTFTGTPTASRRDPTVNYDWKWAGSPASGIASDDFAGRWTGFIQPKFSETYTFATVSDDTVRLVIDGRAVITNTTPHGAVVNKGTITLQAGRRYSITLEHTENGGEATMKLLWSSPGTPQQVVPASQLYPAT